MYGLPYYERGNQAMHSKVAPYNMFAGVPIYDGTDPDTFHDWLYQIESLCEMSHRDVRIELMGWASAQVKCIIRSIPLDIEWKVA